MLRPSPKTMSIAVLFREYQNGNIILTPQYQRNPVWSKTNKIYLIDSILKNFPLPKFFMETETRNELGKIVYKVIDGQQRIRAILDFLFGDLRLDPRYHPFPEQLPEEWRSKTFQQLTSLEQNNFWRYEIAVEELSDSSKEEIKDMFIRLNKNTVKLNNQELRHAQYEGDFIKMVEQLAKEHNSFFTDNKIFTYSNISRMMDVEYISELLVSLMYGIQHKKESLNKHYAENEIMDEAFKTWVPKRFKSIIEHITEIFGKSLPSTRFKNKSDFYSLFRLLFETNKEKYSYNGTINSELKNVLLFVTSHATEDTKIEVMRKYWESTREGSDTLKNREYRNEVLGSLIKPLLIPKDKNRNFSENQRQIIWHLAKKKTCFLCKKPIKDYEDYEPDHIIPWSKGGFTTVGNGQITHSTCNRRKSNRGR